MPELLETIGPRAGDAPLDYLLAELGTVELQAAFAHFDGTSASGSWRPAITVRAQDGTIISRTFPSDTLAAGDTADVTYSPFVPAASASPSGGGLQFDTNPQEGDWLYWDTTGANAPPFGYGLHVQDASAAGILIEHTGPSTGKVIIESDNGSVLISADSKDCAITSNGGAFVAGNLGDGQATFESSGSGGTAVQIRNRNDGNMVLENEGDGNIVAVCDGDGSITLQVDGAGFITLVGLPSSTPGGSGRVWNDAGTLKIT